jgi:hypothetical protein
MTGPNTVIARDGGQDCAMQLASRQVVTTLARSPYQGFKVQQGELRVVPFAGSG